jgi:hypothetical protein
MSTAGEVVREVARQFCLEFLENPYLCYTEHGLHALFFTRLYRALSDYQRYACWESQKVCVIQKEYPTAHDLGKSKRQNWDIAVIKMPTESLGVGKQPAYDYLRLAAAVEVGLNEPEEHLREDIRRLYHKRANIEQGFAIHLYRLSEPGAKVSGRDWSSSSSRILRMEQVEAILTDERANKTAEDRDVEVLYAVTGDPGKHETGVWWITRDGTKRLDRALVPGKIEIGPFPLERIVLCSSDAGPGSQQITAHQAAQFFPGAKWVGRVRNAAARLGTRFFILTTGHGLVAPDQVITPYDVHISTHQAQVEDCWRQTIPPLIDSERCDIVVFYAGGCPRDPYIELLRPILHQQGVSLIAFGKPNMYDSNKIEPFVELLAKGTSTNELRSTLRKPDRLLFLPVVNARQEGWVLKLPTRSAPTSDSAVEDIQGRIMIRGGKANAGRESASGSEKHPDQTECGWETTLPNAVGSSLRHVPEAIRPRTAVEP